MAKLANFKAGEFRNIVLGTHTVYQYSNGVSDWDEKYLFVDEFGIHQRETVDVEYIREDKDGDTRRYYDSFEVIGDKTPIINFLNEEAELDRLSEEILDRDHNYLPDMVTYW